jgi:hypothetical protein
MKNSFYLLALMLFISFSCTKINDEESINAVKSSNTENGISKLYNETATKQIKGRSDFFTSQSNQMKLSGGGSILSGGDFIYGDGWVGWIDPALVEGEVPGEILKEDPKYYGYYVDMGDGKIGIVCPSKGNNCGNLYYLDKGGSPVYCGLYLK